jgi:hypothetical protein
VLADAVGEDRDVIDDVFGLDEAFGAVGGAGAEEIEVVGLQKVDGLDFDGTRGEFMKVENGFFVFEDFGREYGGGA